MPTLLVSHQFLRGADPAMQLRGVVCPSCGKANVQCPNCDRWQKLSWFIQGRIRRALPAPRLPVPTADTIRINATPDAVNTALRGLSYFHNAPSALGLETAHHVLEWLNQ